MVKTGEYAGDDSGRCEEERVGGMYNYMRPLLMRPAFYAILKSSSQDSKDSSVELSKNFLADK
jgi:hypothetical protein